MYKRNLTISIILLVLFQSMIIFGPMNTIDSETSNDSTQNNFSSRNSGYQNNETRLEQSLWPYDGYTLPVIRYSNNILHLVYSYEIPEIAPCYWLCYRRSYDYGMTWSDEVRLFDYDWGCMDIDLIVNGSDLYLIWCDDDYGLHFLKSNDNGTTWGGYRRLYDNFYSEECSIGHYNNNLYVIFYYQGFNYYDLLYLKSNDYGATWSNAIKLVEGEYGNYSSKPDHPEIIAYENNVHLVWEDTRDGNREIYYKKSIDGGTNWGNDIRLTSTSNDSLYPDIAVDGNKIHIAWAETDNGTEEVFYIKSIDNGMNWKNKINLSIKNNSIFDPLIKVYNGFIHFVWEESGDIYYKKSFDDGGNWTDEIKINNFDIYTYFVSFTNYFNRTFFTWENGYGIYYKSIDHLPLIGVIPKNNAINVSISTNVIATFNQPMNHDSVENSFSISPYPTGSFQWDGNICIFIPSSNLSYNTKYTVKIDGTACNLTSGTLDGNGNGISEGSPIDDFISSFTTEKYINPDKTPPTIISFNPSRLAQNVPINTTVQIIFNESMNKSVTESSFSIYPNMYGSFNWTGNGKIMKFIPYSFLNYFETYKITISRTAKDLAGNNLDGNFDGKADNSPYDDFIWRFTTEKYVPFSMLLFPLDQEYITTPIPTLEWELGNGFSNMPNVYYDIYLDTNRNNVENLNKSARVAFNLTETNYTAKTPLEIDYYWTVIPHTNDTYGNCISGVWQFQVDHIHPEDLIPPQIISTIPKNNSIDINVDTNIQVIFSEPMNRTSVEKIFFMDPFVNGEFRWSGNDSILTFYPQNYLNISKNYTVNISIFALDVSGNPLDGNRNFKRDGSPLDDYIWSFTTASFINLKPSLIIDSPIINSTFYLNDTIYFDCLNTTDPDGDLLEFLWVSNISGILGKSPQFSTNLPLGHHQITLFVDDGHGHNISKSVNIIVIPWNRPPIAVISTPRNNAVFNITNMIFFDAANSSDPDNDLLYFYWHSNVSGALGNSRQFNTTLPAGHHVITLFVNDGLYHTVNVSINIYVLNGSTGPPTNGNGHPLKPPGTEEDTGILTGFALYGGIILILIIIIITGFVTATEVGKYGFLGYVIPLYSRLHGKKVLDHETRGLIRGYIIANPGEHYTTIKRELNLKNGTLSHHLKVLEREELIRSKRDGIFKRFYPIEERVPSDLMRVSRIQESILNNIIEHPGITQRGLATKLEVSHQVVNYHVKKLVSSRLVKAERLGKMTKYYAVDESD